MSTHSSLQQKALTNRIDPDAEILTKSIHDPAAFTLIHQKFFPILCRYSLGFLEPSGLSWHDAEDMAQEILVKVFLNRSKFRGESLLSTWIFSIARNTCLNECAKVKFLSLETVAEFPWEHVEQDALRHELTDRMWSLMREALDPEEREVFILAELEELTYQEIAHILECSVGKVFNLRSSAIEKLQSKLTDLGLISR